MTETGEPKKAPIGKLIEGSKPADGSWTYDRWELKVDGRPEPIPLGE